MQRANGLGSMWFQYYGSQLENLMRDTSGLRVYGPRKEKTVLLYQRSRDSIKLDVMKSSPRDANVTFHYAPKFPVSSEMG